MRTAKETFLLRGPHAETLPDDHEVVDASFAASLEREITSTIRVYKDGDQWCATGPGFINLQESDAGFGDTPHAAVSDLGAPCGDGEVKR